MIYLDCNATTPVDPEVLSELTVFLTKEYGNAGSRTHESGLRAKRAVEAARREVASVVDARSEEIIFTSGATESNNLAILGLMPWATASKRKHLVTTSIEHKAVLEPFQWLAQHHGFEVTIIQATSDGIVDLNQLQAVIRPDTALISVMHVNNETGVIQPLDKVIELLNGHAAYLHVDAAQGFGKELHLLRNHRIDLISISGHKLYAPKGIGALVARKRNGIRPPLTPLFHGGGQEFGLRAGTLPVHLIVGLGAAAKLAVRDHSIRIAYVRRFQEAMLAGLEGLPLQIHGDLTRMVPHVLNFSIGGVDSEAAMVALKGLVEISNGSACTSSKYAPSHVLEAMGLSQPEVSGALRFSWCHMTPSVNWTLVRDVISGFLA